MKRILFINGHLNTGGVERSLVDVLRHIDYTKHEIDLLLLQGKGDYEREIPKEVFIHAYDITEAYGPLVSTIAQNTIKGKWFLIIYRLIIQILGIKFLSLLIPSLRKRYDTAIAYRCGICTDILVEVVKSGNKISWWHHGEMNLNESEKEHLYTDYRKIKHIIAVSESSATLVKQNFPEVKDKVCVIPNMVCSNTIQHKALEQCKITFESYSDTFHIVSVGRLSPEKNMKFCVTIAKTLKEKSIPFEWVLVGNGEEYDSINQMILENNLEKELRLVGALTNPYSLIQSADLLFHPSLVESQGLTILEAMALGTPVVCVKSAGPAEFIQNGKNGIMIPNDIDEAADTICRLIKDEKWCKGLSETAKKTIISYNPDCIWQQIEKIL